ncbi:glycoside hydrolase/deacetylase [Rickenella mellea]|uniref:chitin deacetylase n=1 Tax=Rickenella mellea TaxID=50990 RepID=A0A4Y7PS43_9AGAM|nr:glycoside hydrolase/deacetylase [Rickenella mellea]
MSSSSLRLLVTSVLLATVSVFDVVVAGPVANGALQERHHSHEMRSALPGSWFHTEEGEVHKLFRRQNLDAGGYPAVGSPAWTAAYPSGTPDNTKLPQAWVDKLNAAVAAGTIPNIPQTTVTNGGTVYPNGVQRDSPEVCSADDFVCRSPDDVWDAPNGTVAIGFDDGPLQPSGQLYDFLAANNQKATHFYIGINILGNPDLFNRAYATMGDDIAVHTWTHPYMTSLANIDVLAQLGYTMQIIHDSTGGRLPRYWRPPYGDIDNRVRAIAKQVFNMTAIIWNHDTGDWTGASPDKIKGEIQGWLNGPKSPGLIILEHELSASCVQGFMEAYPLFAQNGWTTTSTATLVSAPGSGPWQNAANNTGPVTGAAVGGVVPAIVTTSSSAPATTTNSTAAAAATSTPKKSRADQTSRPVAMTLAALSGFAALLLL